MKWFSPRESDDERLVEAPVGREYGELESFLNFVCWFHLQK